MTEAEARDWIATCYSPGVVDRLARYVDALLAANAEQNLISRASEPVVWTRHILDSAQLARFAPDAANWLDIGSGPGLPGLILAILSNGPITLVEPRRKRVDFMRSVADDLGLSHATIVQAEVERLPPATYPAVTARAFTALPQIFASTIRLTDSSTIWVLPKGRSAEHELAEARGSWHGVFHVEQSLTDEDARIIVATDVRARR